jgi:uncharacterized protein (TIGR04255 family)
VYRAADAGKAGRDVSVTRAGFRYPNAPIAEAVFDIRVEELSDEQLARVAAFTDADYPKREETVLTGAELQSGPLGVTTKATRHMNGFRYTSQDGLQIVQMRNDGFTFSRLAPYEEWAIFHVEARRLLGAYVELGTPSFLTRLALRYINQVKVPAGHVQIDEYLRTRPEISNDMPTATSGYFMTVDIPLPFFGSAVRITQTILPSDVLGGSPSLVLDIDVFREGRWDPSDVDLTAAFNDLRGAKNMVFEASITDKARELFQ